MPTLFDPVQLGALHLPNRLVMSPLTRCRASAGRVPNELMARYYAQRAGAGLIISEATSVMPMGVGYPDTPGIWSKEQVAGWKLVTDAVHAAGPHCVAALACGPHFRPLLPEWRAARGTKRHCGARPCQPAAAKKGLCHPEGLGY